MRTQYIIPILAIAALALTGCCTCNGYRANPRLNAQLRHAVGNSDSETARELIYRGAWFETDDDLQAALFLAIISSDVQLARVVLDQGANANTHDSRGATLIFDAAQHGSVEMLQLLMNRGAKDDLRKLADVAQEWGHDDASAFLIQAAQRRADYEREQSLMRGKR